MDRETQDQIVADTIIKPMVDRFAPPQDLGLPPSGVNAENQSETEKKAADRYRAKRKAKLKDYFDDLREFSQSILEEAFIATRRRAEEHQINKDPAFRPRWPSSVMFRQEALAVRKVRNYFKGAGSIKSGSSTARKWDMWNEWQKNHWKQLSFAGQMALKEYFFREWGQYTRETGHEPANAIAIITEGVLAHFQTEHGQSGVCSDPVAREFLEGVLRKNREDNAKREAAQ